MVRRWGRLRCHGLEENAEGIAVEISHMDFQDSFESRPFRLAAFGEQEG